MAATPAPGFLGRFSEREALDALLASVRGGRSEVLIIRGEAGIGKTALLRYAARRAAGFRVTQVTGVEAEMELPFAATHRLCAPMLAHLDALPRPQRDAVSVALGLETGDVPDSFLVGLAVLGLLSAVAEDRPLLCLVEDAQWLDAASSHILGFVARRVLAESVAIVVAVRDGSDSDRSTDDFDGLPELRLEGLPEDQARALLSGAVAGRLDDRVRDRIVAETRGNPLALLELPGHSTAAELAGGFELHAEADLPAYIENHYLRRVGELPEVTQRLMLLASADPLGDATLVWRAAQRLDIEPSALKPAKDAELLEIGARVRFRHPLVRSAVYRAASPDNRQRVHEVLAEVSDPEVDADRCAWHRALAAAGVDEDVAAELEQSAGRAQSRGGVAATAAFLQRAVVLTPDPTRRRERALAAAQASLQAGQFDVARGLLATAQAGALDDLQRARIELLRAEVAFASRRDSTAPASLLHAAKRIAPFDAGLARASYLEALSAAMFAGRLARPGGGPRDVADAVQAAPPASPRSPADVLLDGWAALFADGCAAAAPTLQEALAEFGHPAVAADQLHLLWLVTITAPVVWDDARWEELSRRHVELARSSGAVSELPLALNSRAYVHLFRGELEDAGALIEEARVAIEATGASLTSWGALALAVLRGREQDACTMLDAATADATQRGEGISLTVIAWARAVLYNGLRLHDKALAAARAAIDCPTNSAAAAWGMVELIEAAARVGEPEAAGEAAWRFGQIADAAGTHWALGVTARSRALLSTGATAEQLYREALDHLGRCQMRMELARAHLLYGEWLRRENRRIDARDELRSAHGEFTAMGMEAFAERARGELHATGENVRKRTDETRDDLTARERQIAHLARDGLSNPEIGARLFLSPRSVEWHLRNVFSKLGIRSRRQLASALPAGDLDAVAT
jgi:DNA-binding CsgD family transcriptional regulator